MNVGEIEYTVSVKTQQAINAAQQFDRQMAQMQDSARRTDRELGRLDSGFSKLATAIKGVIAVSALRSMAGMVQRYQAMAERVEMATRSTEEFELVQRRLQTTADGTYRSLEEAQELYIRTADSIRGMGYSLEQAIDIQDSMSYAFVTNATTADRAQATIDQFTKAINTGRVSVIQWMTISNAIPSVINDIAAASGKTASEVRALGAAGKLTARELTEGFRKSLDATRAAADNMVTDLIDAGVRWSNALTTVLVGLENQTGAIQAVTNGIIMASEAMLEFGQDTEKMEAFLQLATVAGASLAAVMAGRMLTAMGTYTAKTGRAIFAERARLAEQVKLTAAANVRAVQEQLAAKRALANAVNDTLRARAINQLAAANQNLIAATAASTAATTAYARSATVAGVASRGLDAAMKFLGGPAGLILLAGAAFLTMGTNAKTSAVDLDNLGDTISELGQKTLEYRKVQLEEALREQEAAAAKAEQKFKDMGRQLAEGLTRSEGFRRKTKEVGAQMEEARAKANQYADTLRQVNDELDKRKSAPQNPEGSGEPPAPTTTLEGQQRLQAMRDEIELARQVGVARARLAAVQRMGAEATAEEHAEAERLATELYNLKKAQDAAKKLLDAAKSDEEVIAALNEQLYQTTLTADELRDRQAELQLSKYATPEQYEEVRALAKVLSEAEQKAADLERRRSTFGTDVAGAITGNTSPLSGGKFDDQTERYEAEAQAEQQRYADAMARLQEAKELELEVKGGYMALEQQMAQEHADRLAQIEQAKNDMMMTQAADAFGSMASNLQDYITTFSGEHKALTAMMKASAIAQTIIQTYQGAQQAFTAMSAIPVVGPALGVAAAAAAVAGGMARVASIKAQGSRRQGGPVAAGGMYRVNEGGAPEIFQNNLGQQYMMPNSRGEVISNKDASGSGGSGVVINIHNAPEGTRTDQSESPTGEQMIDIWIADFTSDGRTANAVQGKFGLSPQGR